MTSHFRNRFLTADPHFFHEAMLRPDTVGRPFSSVEEMNEVMIDNWNSVVKPTDIIDILGDFALHASAQDVAVIFHRLNGQKNLIIGNHDTDKKGNLLPSLARLPWGKPPAHLDEINFAGQRIVLSHYAMVTWNAKHHGSFLAFGHSHGKIESLPGSVDVGVDPQGFKPISVEDFILQAEKTFVDAPTVVERFVDQTVFELYRDDGKGWVERGRKYKEEHEAKERRSAYGRGS